MITANTISEERPFHSVITIGGMNTLGSRIAHFRKQLDISQGELAKACGWDSQSRIGNYEKDLREPTLGDIEKIAHALHRHPSELLPASFHAKESNVIAADFSRQKTPKGTISIPQFDIAASMGKGAIRPEFDVVIDSMVASIDYLSRNVRYSAPENLALITGYGDSMKPTFADGDILLVDIGVNDIKIDAVYVMALRDELYIKRMQRRADGTFLMISDNAAYPPIEVAGTDLKRFQVLARVLLAWNANKL